MRLDQRLLELKLCADLPTAQGLIMGNQILVNDQPAVKPGLKVKESDQIRVRHQTKWVSRSAVKLDHFLEENSISVTGRVCLDVGASTGGFTQVLLERGASLIYALDVAYGIIDHKLRNHAGVRMIERTNIRNIDSGTFSPLPEFWVADVSFISVTEVFRAIHRVFPSYEAVVLFKPQFETSRDNLRKGVVVSQEVTEEELRKFEEFIASIDVRILGKDKASIRGARGNQEYLYYLRYP